MRLRRTVDWTINYLYESLTILRSGSFVTQRRALEKIGKQIYQVRSRYFHLAFERLFSHFRSRDHYNTKKGNFRYINALLRIALNKHEETDS